MRKSIVNLAFIGAIAQLVSCQPEKVEPFLQPSKGGKELVVRGESVPAEERVQIELGKKLENPYLKTRMMEAWNIAYPAYPVDDLPVTHRQITFNPTEPEQVYALQDAGIDTYTYPFGYEIVNEGNYYLEPGTTEQDVPVLYAVVPEHISIPDGIPYTVEAELCLLPLETRATREAFLLAGLEYKEELTEALPDVPPVDVNSADFTAAIIDLTRDKDGPNSVPVSGRGNDYSDGDAGDGTLASSACGCYSWPNEDKPAGCIKVEDTQWGGLYPLPDVRVSFRSIFFSRRAYTNEHGCFQIDHDYWPACHGYVYFDNWLVNVRSLDYNLFDTHNDPLGYYNLMGSTHINNLDIQYWKSSDRSNTYSSYYVAATFMNSVRNFHQYCYNDGITPPPTNMRVLLMKEQGASSAPMLKHLGAAGYYAVLAGLVSPGFSAFVGTLLYPLAMPIYAGLAPDMLIGYNWSDISFKSDRMRERMYHELAHTIHYREAAPIIWCRNIEFVVGNYGVDNNDPYGANGITPTTVLDADHKRCQLIESWAYFLGKVYAHRTYGNNHHSYSSACNSSWIASTESSLANWYFPYPLLQDLRDKSSDYCAAFEHPAILGHDKIHHGYTIKQMYESLNSNESIQAWRSNLPNTGQTVANMNELFSSYPYMQ